MAQAISKDADLWTVADILERFGPIPAFRIRHDPAPGTATEDDILRIYAEEKRHCELVDGILLEKTVGLYESVLAMVIGRHLGEFVAARNLGVVAGEGGTLRILTGMVRIPDVSYIAWSRLPGGRIPEEPIPDLVPDLAVDVLSRWNTRQEMDRKLRDYFTAGVRLVWYVDPDDRTVRVYTSVDQSTLLNESHALDGGDVLPGFTLSIERIFADPQLRNRSGN